MSSGIPSNEWDIKKNVAVIKSLGIMMPETLNI